MRQVELIETKDYLIDLMAKTGQILKRYFAAEKLSVTTKDKLDIVTEADLAANNFITKKLKNNFPEIPILSEETHEGDFTKYKRKKLLWIVDPLDGTANFSKKIDHFAVSIGLISYSRSVLGVVYNPMTDCCYWATEERGAYLNEKKIEVSQTNDLNSAVIGTDTSHNVDTFPQTVEVINKLIRKTRQILIMGSTALDLCLVASGKLDVYHHVYCMPWDVAAAGLIVQKAGGLVTDTDGGKWDASTPGILVANPILHKKTLSLLS